MINSTYFSQQLLAPEQARLLDSRILAHLGDAVFALFERERELLCVGSVKQMHNRVAKRTSAVSQSDLLEKILPELTEEEHDIVRWARNIKAGGTPSGGQRNYRRATAFEALLGYLYLTRPERLRQLLELTL